MEKEYVPPLECAQEADERTIREMQWSFQKYEASDIEGLFKQFTQQGEPNSEI